MILRVGDKVRYLSRNCPDGRGGFVDRKTIAEVVAVSLVGAREIEVAKRLGKTEPKKGAIWKIDIRIPEDFDKPEGRKRIIFLNAIDVDRNILGIA